MPHDCHLINGINIIEKCVMTSSLQFSTVKFDLQIAQYQRSHTLRILFKNMCKLVQFSTQNSERGKKRRKKEKKNGKKKKQKRTQYVQVL